MSIPASQIVQVNPRLLTPGGTDLEFNGLLLSDSPLIPASQLVLPFPDSASVGEYFGLESPEYQAAQVYFLGYNNSFKKPRALYIASRVAEATAAWLRGGAWNGTLTALKQAGVGGLTLTVNGETVRAQNVSFATAASPSDVAQVLQSALNAGSTPGTPARPAVLTGGSITFSGLESITDGGFAIEVNGTEHEVEGLDLSAVTSPLELATALTGKIPGVMVSASADGLVLTTTETGAAASIGYAAVPASGTDVSTLLALTSATGADSVNGADAVPPVGVPGITVAYSSLTKAWTITSPTTGAESAITYAQAPETGVDFAGLLNLTEQAGAVLSPGLDAMSHAANMEAILDLTENFVCFTTVAQPAMVDALELAQWASGNGVAYLYIYWDNDPKLLQPNNTSTIAAALTEANVGATCGVWNSLAYAAMIMGTAASIDWERRNGTITFAFKSQDGLAANVVTGTDAINLEAQNMNFMGDYATRNDQFVFLYPGRMFGQWTWIDTYLNAVWLNNALQVACMAGFEQTPRVPYNDEGYALVRAWMQDPVNRALYSGIIDTGVTLSESQKAELTREAGRDISAQLFTDGYVIQVNDPAPTVRQKRESPEASCWYCYGGSVHKLTIASTALV